MNADRRLSACGHAQAGARAPTFCILHFAVFIFQWSEATISMSSKNTKDKGGLVGFCVNLRSSAVKKG